VTAQHLQTVNASLQATTRDNHLMNRALRESTVFQTHLLYENYIRHAIPNQLIYKRMSTTVPSSSVRQ
jgi:hypothetical protein